MASWIKTQQVTLHKIVTDLIPQTNATSVASTASDATMTQALPEDAKTPADILQRARIRTLACRVEGVTSFAELTTLVMARQLARRGRRSDARRLLQSYLRQHPKTGRIEALLRAI